MKNSAKKCDILLIAMRKIIRAIDLHSKQLDAQYGLTGPQMLILKVINQADEPITSTDIASQVSLSQATITSILDRLVQKNYVERIKASKDKRKSFIQATSKTIDVFKQNPTLLQVEFIAEFEKLKEWEQYSMISTVERIADMMQAKAIDASPVLTNSEIVSQQGD